MVEDARGVKTRGEDGGNDVATVGRAVVEI